MKEVQRGQGLAYLGWRLHALSSPTNPAKPPHLIIHPMAVLRRPCGVFAGCSMAFDARRCQRFQGKWGCLHCNCARVLARWPPASRQCLPIATCLQVDKVWVMQCLAIANQSHITPVAPEAERTSYFYNDWWVHVARRCGSNDAWCTAAARAGCGSSALVRRCTPPACCSVHPSHQGLLALGDLLVHPLERAVEDAIAGKRLPKRRADPRLEGLPPPMIPNTPDLSSSVCFMLVRPLPAAQAVVGWVTNPWRQAAGLALYWSCCSGLLPPHLLPLGPSGPPLLCTPAG